ncbi:hypothetical protein NUU61_004549 [Penicillium alfredii]|uniref:Uncharacterized protein n=1 Tax=Penicillium alfredii TaxID=1506179 RepID=A0A9W9FLE7_9EURO|nr:uncharacterized protein NUU61_004549 [Penicillium alfredii]KAJ5102327.1 hypothetical protein NUU61_004549 [Penicillium alfredii]
MNISIILDTHMYIDGSGQKVFGYDWEKCVDLASLFEAVENADNYMFFGMAMALKPVEWHRGKKMVT